MADAGVEGVRELGLRLRVAVQVDALGVEAGASAVCSSPPLATSHESPSSANSR